jgi:protein-L-isoaspartate(D-aspartate) O-methyltransferase
MNETEFVTSAEQMVLEIEVHARLTAAETGKETFSDPVMEAIGKVPRHEFVPVELQSYAYLNRPLPIGYGKTISQPFIVALMTDLLRLDKDDVVLEIGTGLGYQAAILAQLVRQVYSVEIIEELETEARKRLKRQGYANVETRLANGCYGWPEHGPFDAIMVTAAPDLIPPALIQQLKAGGRMMIPTGASLETQQLMLVEKDAAGRTTVRELLPVRFTSLIMEEDDMMDEEDEESVLEEIAEDEDLEETFDEEDETDEE